MISLTRNKKLFYLTVLVQRVRKDFPNCLMLHICKVLQSTQKPYSSYRKNNKINIKNKQAERYVFRKRTQLQGESISEYVAALHDLATTCDFGDFLDAKLCDQLIKILHNSKIRKRLLADEKLDLTKAVKTAVRLERREIYARVDECKRH